MSEVQPIRIVRKDQVNGTLREHTQATQTNERQFLAEFEDGIIFIVPESQLIERDEATYYLDYTRAELESMAINQKITIPVIEETLHVDKRTVTTGGVRVRKTVQEHEELIEEPLLREHVQVERVEVNRIADKQTQLKPYQQGDTLIIPVVKEVLVLQKQYIVTEEIRVTKTAEQVVTQETVTLREETVDLEPIKPTNDQA